MIRAFIAVEVPAAVRAAMGEAQARLKRVRLGVKVSWVNPGNLHLTLQFLGHIAEEATAGIGAALEEVAVGWAPFEVAVRGAGMFPDGKRPRVLWVGCVDGGGQLAGLAGAVRAAMGRLGFEAERRAFTAHLTLGRVKTPRADDALTRAMDSLKDSDFGTMRVEAIHLMRSQLHPEGSVYTKVSSHPLGRL
jgi:2'-5' RNA ligase